jgi:hypothetical protein
MIHFASSLPQVVQTPRLRAQSYKLLLQVPITSLVPPLPALPPHPRPSDYKSEVLTSPSSGLTICYNSSQNSGKPLTYCSLFIIKDTTQEWTDGRHTGQGVGKGVQLACPLQVRCPPSTLTIHPPRALQFRSPGIFMDFALHRHD